MTRIERLRRFAAPLAPDTGVVPADAAEPEWSEPFHEAWLAGEGLDYPVRLARAQAAELAAARPVVRPC